MQVSNASKVLELFVGKRLVVLGDLVADEYIHGTTSRISREAPVLIISENDREIRLGGAANVVANIKAMGGKPLPIGLVGDDLAGRCLLQKLSDLGVDCSGIVTDGKRFTTTKTRVLAGGKNTVRQQMIRLDRLNHDSVSCWAQQEIKSRLRQAMDGVSGLVVSDYGEGVVGKGLIELICDIADEGTNVFVDSRFRVGSFHGVAALTPNEPELAASVGYELDGLDAVERAGQYLLKKTGSKAVLLKRGRNGMALFLPGVQTQFTEAYGSAEVADVTGAGDTVLAAWSLASLCGADSRMAMKIANLAGGIKVGKVGTAVVDAKELLSAIYATDS